MLPASFIEEKEKEEVQFHETQRRIYKPQTIAHELCRQTTENMSTL